MVVIAAGLVAARLKLQPPTVPAYRIDGAEGVVPVVRTGPFAITIHPANPVDGAVGARGFLLENDRVRPWDPPVSVASDGSVTIAGDAATLFQGVPSGAWEVAVAIGRPEMLPTAPLDVLGARARAPGAAAWQLVRERIMLGP